VNDALKTAGALVAECRDPVLLAKAIKNGSEIEGHRAAQLRDGAVLARFLRWVSAEGPKGEITEESAADHLLSLRAKDPLFRDCSFETISAFGPSGAVIHYNPGPSTNRRLEPGSLYLVDSGAQYCDATTDVTRTVAIGIPDKEMRDRYTRVLKGHIALASAIFPKGTKGIQLDSLARQFLWAEGLDYATGTGHGVGSFLSVHEGPHLIHRIPRADEPLVPGMITSNEPGYYKPGAYGIRIENLMLVVERPGPLHEKEMLGFEILSLAPLDRALIDSGMLSAAEVEWIDQYHQRVAKLVGPELEGADRDWLLRATAPLLAYAEAERS
jgi:Xaa-Pro aminopeptidase